jgi:hypothetical protein
MTCSASTFFATGQDEKHENWDIKKKCEQQLARWMHEAVKWERKLTGFKALA